MSYFRDQLESWLKEIDVKAGEVLDVGGAANPVKGRTKSWDVGNCDIIDKLIEPPAVGIKFYQGDIQEYDFTTFALAKQTLGEEALKYEVVFCLEVAEYLCEPLRALKNIATFLDPGGVLYISFMFVYGLHNPPGNDYLRYTPEGAEALLYRSGFKIEEHILRFGNDLLTKFYELDKMRIRKGMNHNVTGSLIKAKKM